MWPFFHRKDPLATLLCVCGVAAELPVEDFMAKGGLDPTAFILSGLITNRSPTSQNVVPGNSRFSQHMSRESLAIVTLQRAQSFSIQGTGFFGGRGGLKGTSVLSEPQSRP